MSAREAGPQQLQPWEAIGLIEVSYQGRTGTTEFSTTDDGAICVTDLRLT